MSDIAPRCNANSNVLLKLKVRGGARVEHERQMSLASPATQASGYVGIHLSQQHLPNSGAAQIVHQYDSECVIVIDWMNNYEGDNLKDAVSFTSKTSTSLPNTLVK